MQMQGSEAVWQLVLDAHLLCTLGPGPHSRTTRPVERTGKNHTRLTGEPHAGRTANEFRLTDNHSAIGFPYGLGFEPSSVDIWGRVEGVSPRPKN